MTSGVWCGRMIVGWSFRRQVMIAERQGRVCVTNFIKFVFLFDVSACCLLCGKFLGISDLPNVEVREDCEIRVSAEQLLRCLCANLCQVTFGS